MKNLWKLFAVSAFALVPVTANAAVTVDNNGVCAASDNDEIRECLKNSKTKSLKLTGGETYTLFSGDAAVNIDEITLTAATDTTINVYNKSVTVKSIDSANVAVNIAEGGKLTLTDASTLKSVSLNGKTNGATLTAKDLTADVTAEEGAKVTITGALEGAINASKKAEVTVTNSNGKAVEGNVTVTEDAKVVVSAKTVGIDGDVVLGTAGKAKEGATLTVTASSVRNAIENGEITTNGVSTLTVNSGNVVAKITMADNSKLIAEKSEVTPATDSEITGGSMTAKKVIGNGLTINGETAIVKYDEGNSTLTQGIQVVTEKNDITGKDEKVVKSAGVEEVTVANGEVFDINGMDADVKAINAANGAIIRNSGNTDTEVIVNENKVTIKSDNELVVTNGKPVEPENPTDPTDPDKKPTDPDKVPDVPKTGDTVLVSSALGLVSLIGLAATVKARKFN